MWRRRKEKKYKSEIDGLKICKSALKMGEQKTTQNGISHRRILNNCANLPPNARQMIAGGKEQSLLAITDGEIISATTKHTDKHRDAAAECI